MKRSELGGILRLSKSFLEEERRWGIDELPESARPAETVAVETVMQARPQKTSAGGGELDDFKREISGCTKCGLGKSRINVVFGVGSPRARLMFIGEGPGFDEDHTGEPFVGRAGQLLTKIIESIGLKREEVYIANIVKCHPMIDPSDPEKRGNDRPPTPEEVAACMPYLEKQIEIIHPEVLCVLGNSAAQALLKVETGISRLRGRFCEYQGIPLMPTYHPAALLRNPSLKKDVWEDMKMIRAKLAAS